MFITAEFVFINPELNEIKINIKNTQLKYMQKNVGNSYTEINVKCNVNFFDGIENKTKIIMIEHENIFGKVNKIMQSPKGMIKFIRALGLTIRIQGRIQKKYCERLFKM